VTFHQWRWPIEINTRSDLPPTHTISDRLICILVEVSELEICEASCHFCEAQVGWSWLQSLASWSSFWLCRVGGITLSQAIKARKDDSFLSEASELRQDPRRTSHLSQPKHFVLSEASELRQDPRRTSHLSQPEHFMLSEASELSQIRGVLHS